MVQFGGITNFPVPRRKLNLQLGKSVGEHGVSVEVEWMSWNFRMCGRDAGNIHDDKWRNVGEVRWRGQIYRLVGR